jgi:hypothetical protein
MSAPHDSILSITNKGNQMQSIRIVTLSPTGLVQEFVQECRNPETALAIIQGTMQGCTNTGWSIKELSVL